MPGTRRKERVLIVDDEPLVLRALRDALEDEFHVTTTTVPQDALDLAASHGETAVVISDQRMRGMLGHELLRRLREVSQASTILLTGYADIEVVMRAVNEGNILFFLTKPWANSALRAKVHQAAQHFRLARDLAQERQMVRDLMTSIPDAIYFTNREHRFTLVNDALVRLSGQANASELIGKRRGDLPNTLPPELIAAIERQDEEIWRDGQPRRDIINQVQTPTGRRHLATTKAAMHSPGGEVVGVVSIARDITERVHAEEALRASEERLRLAFLASKAGLFDWDIATGEVSYSPRAGKAVEVSPGSTFAALEQRVHPEDLPGLRVAIAAHLQTREPFTAVQLRTRPSEDLGYRWYEVNVQASWDDAGRPLRVVGSFSDIDDLRLAQTRLVQAQKLEGIGQLAAGIAHEINTPTQYVTDNVTFLDRAFTRLRSVLNAYQVALAAERSGQDQEAAGAALEACLKSSKLDYVLEQAPRAIQQSLEGLTRVSSIVKAMKEFSHPSAAEKEPMDLREIIECSCVVARNEWKYVAELDYDFDADLPNVPVLRGELSQVFLNLVVNAAHAIAAAKQREPDRVGAITISTRQVEESAEIRVTDTGTGIPEAIRSRVFEPFFTTKEVGKGTGQGLAIAYSVVVDKHRGTIHFESELGRGTTFVIRLPLVEPAATTA